MALSGEIRLGGKRFSVINYDAITVRNEHYVMKFMRETGLDRALPKVEDEADAVYLARLMAEVRDTLKLPELLGGYLLPAGATEDQWTLEMAAETANHIARLTRPEDKAEVHRLGQLVTLDFFQAGLVSLRTSERSFERSGTMPASHQSNEGTGAH